MSIDAPIAYGCGRSLRWEVNAVDIARELYEDCVHLDVFTVIVRIIIKDVTGKKEITCKVSCPDCNCEYSKTSEKLTKLFNKFYGR
jgi:hypothetical protein